MWKKIKSLFSLHENQRHRSTRIAVLLTLLALGTDLVNAGPANKEELSSLRIVEEIDLRTPGGAVAVTWSADGSALAAASSYGNVMTVWNREGHVINQMQRPGAGPVLGRSLAFVSGSSKLAFLPPEPAQGDAALAVWDVKSGAVLRTVVGPQPGDDYTNNRAEHFMVSPDQKRLATATRTGIAWQGFQKNVTIYETDSWHAVNSIAVDTGVGSLCIFGGGRLIVLGTFSQQSIVVLDAMSGVTVNAFRAYPESEFGTFDLGAVAGSPAGDLVMASVGLVVLKGRGGASANEWASSLETVRMFRVSDGSFVASLSAPKTPVRQAAWDPKGRFVALVDNQGGLFLWAPWRTSSYRRITLPTRGFSLAIAPAGDRIAVTTDWGVRVYSIS